MPGKNIVLLPTRPTRFFSGLPTTLWLCFVALPLLLGSNCDVYQPTVEGSVGTEGKVVYGVDGLTQAFESVFAVGSMFEVKYTAAGSSSLDQVKESTLRSTDEAVLVIDEQTVEQARVQIVGVGQAGLEVVDADGEIVDVIVIRARENFTYQLLDPVLIGSSVDARLPNSFAIVENSQVSFVPSSLDGCGQPLLAFNGFDVSLEPTFSVPPGVELVEHTVQSGLVHTFSVDEPGEFTLRVFDGEDEVFSADVEVIERRDVDDIVLYVAAAEETQAEVWGRIYGNGWEVIGEVLTWSASPRVTLSSGQGPNTVASIFVPGEGEPIDDRPAVVEASAFGEEGELDLFASTTANVATSRTPADDVTYKEPESFGGCDGGSTGFETCSMGILFLFGGRLKRRRKNKNAK
ncbi:MAG: hypothetical protein GY822_32395 [Deltaproteobacteria bacterium]|nr:hypothetical protein [Deltaproteobacteria bacterium]